MPKFEFVRYTGSYLVLCHGDLMFTMDDKFITLNVSLEPGGTITFDDNGLEQITVAPWKDIFDWSFIDHPEFKKWKPEILKMINENVPYGPCGGCI